MKGFFCSKERSLKIINILFYFISLIIVIFIIGFAFILNKYAHPLERIFNIITRLIVSFVIFFLIKTVLELQRYNKQLEQIAFFDVLTNLPNRRLLYDRLRYSIIQAQHTEKILAICYLDIDDLKPVNDTMGHKAGDLLLREGDIVSRIGGDEFIIALHDLKSLEECDIILNRILKCINAPIILGNNFVEISVSIGVSFYSNNNKDIDSLISQADQAMYKAKKSGKGNYEIFKLSDISFI